MIGHPHRGWLWDYLDLKKMVDPLVAVIDHSFLCDRSDTLIANFLESSGLKAVYVDFPTTAETSQNGFLSG